MFLIIITNKTKFCLQERRFLEKKKNMKKMFILKLSNHFCKRKAKK